MGAALGFGSALVGSVEPMVAPFFLARGLVRGAYIGTEAAAAIVMHLTKLIVFGAAAALTWRTGLHGIALAPGIRGPRRVRADRIRDPAAGHRRPISVEQASALPTISGGGT